MTKHPSYRARDQPESGSASQHRKDKIMHKFEKRDAKSRTLVILAVVVLAAALTVGIFTAVLSGLFAVYYFNLDMKLMRSVVLPFLDKHYDSVKREHLI